MPPEPFPTSPPSAEPMALLLAAGLATRLGSLREKWAKACIPVGGASPLAFLLPRLFRAGIRQVWINLHHMPEQVREEAQQAAPPGLDLQFLEEERLFGTGGTLLAVTQRAGRFPDLVINAKLYTDLEFDAILKQPAPLVVLHPESSLEDFGGLRFNQQRRVTGLRLRGAPRWEAGAAVYMGICRPGEAWLDPLAKAARERPQDTLCLIRDGLLPAVEQHRPTKVVLHSGYWYEISTPERIAEADRLLRLGPRRIPDLLNPRSSN